MTLSLAVGLAAAPSGHAFKIKLKKDDKPPVDYTVWVASQDLPAKENGKRLFYPATDNEDGLAFVKADLPVAGIDATALFLASLLHTVDNLDADSGESLVDVDYDGLRFTVLKKTTRGKNNREVTFTRKVDVAARQGELVSRIYDIAVRYREKGLIPRTLPFEALHPESNERHAELVLEFASLNGDDLDAMARYASTRGDITAPHIDDVKGGKVTEGMNPDEVRLVLGPPLEERKSGEKTRWIYGNECVVIFTDGLVSRIVG